MTLSGVVPPELQDRDGDRTTCLAAARPHQRHDYSRCSMCPANAGSCGFWRHAACVDGVPGTGDLARGQVGTSLQAWGLELESERESTVCRRGTLVPV